MIGVLAIVAGRDGHPAVPSDVLSGGSAPIELAAVTLFASLGMAAS